MHAIGILHDCLCIILHVTRPLSTYIVQMHNSTRTTFRTCILFASLVIHREARDNVFCLHYFKIQQRREVSLSYVAITNLLKMLFVRERLVLFILFASNAIQAIDDEMVVKPKR